MRARRIISRRDLLFVFSLASISGCERSQGRRIGVVPKTTGPRFLAERPRRGHGRRPRSRRRDSVARPGDRDRIRPSDHDRRLDDQLPRRRYRCRSDRRDRSCVRGRTRASRGDPGRRLRFRHQHGQLRLIRRDRQLRRGRSRRPPHGPSCSTVPVKSPSCAWCPAATPRT